MRSVSELKEYSDFALYYRNASSSSLDLSAMTQSVHNLRPGERVPLSLVRMGLPNTAKRKSIRTTTSMKIDRCSSSLKRIAILVVGVAEPPDLMRQRRTLEAPLSHLKIPLLRSR